LNPDIFKKIYKMGDISKGRVANTHSPPEKYLKILLVYVLVWSYALYDCTFLAWC
jgi:hypothetical protein